MAWHVVALQELSEDLSRDPQAERLGVAAYRVADFPGAAADYEVGVYEVDAGEEGADDGDDLLATLQFTVGEGRSLTISAGEQSGVTADDPELGLRFLIEGATEGQHLTIRLPLADNDDPDFELEIGLRLPEQTGHSEEQILVRVGGVPRFERPAIEASREWDKETWSIPREDASSALEGMPIEWDRRPHVRAGARLIRITRYRGTLGLIYGGGPSARFLNPAIRQLRREHLAASEPYRALSAEAMRLLTEGGPSAVNTYDNQVLTLGMGYAGTRLEHVLDRLAETPCAEPLAEAFASYECFDGLTLDSERLKSRAYVAEARRLRLDGPALAHYVRVAEHPRYGLDVARANVAEFVEFDAVGVHGRRGPSHEELTWANQRAQAYFDDDDKPFRALVGVVGYLRHGTSGVVRHPIRDVKFAHDRTDIPSKQLAVVFQLYAARLRARWLIDRVMGGADGHGRNMIFGKRIEEFEDALRFDEVESWKLDYASFQRVIPCIKPPPDGVDRPSWTHLDRWEGKEPDEVPEEHVHLDFRGKRYDFGHPVS